MYAIRHKPSGAYLPVPYGRGGRGGSHVDPIHFKGDPKQLPRMFPTLVGAKAALGQWLLGKFECDRSYGYDSLNHEYWQDENVRIVPVPHRVREDMEIIQVFVSLPEPEE